MEIEISEALDRSNVIFIDVRSPGEYKEASIPGAVNIPLFDDQEHRLLGITFREKGEAIARRIALGMASPKLTELVDQITAASGSNIPLLYCYRGGLRSLSLYQILKLSGIKTMRLKRGYKGFRRHINERLKNYVLEKEIHVLHGLTGVGKTAVLEELERKSLPVINLEAIAGHRGSVFGAIGMNTTRSQKDFDALLLQQLDRYKDAPYFLIEGESRRIGNIYLPAFLSEAMEKGNKILLTASIEIRARRIVEIYAPTDMANKEMEELQNSLYSLSRRMGKQKVNSLIRMLQEGHYLDVAKILCADYYDHFYSDSHLDHANFEVIIDATDIKNAATQIADRLNVLQHCM